MTGPGADGGRRQPSRTVSWAVAVYRRTIAFSPASFRPWRDAAVADFERVASDERRRRGRVAVAVALARALGDLVARAPSEWLGARRIGVSSTREGPMETVWHELTSAARGLRRRPFFTLVATTTLALGVGVAVTIFTVVDAVLIRPLPYPDADRIVTVRHHAPGLDLPELENSEGTAHFYRARSRTLASYSLVDARPANLTGGALPSQVETARVSPSFFEVMGVEPSMGRAFRPEEELPGSPPVTVLTHHGWVQHLGQDPGVLGRTLEIDGTPLEIVGVMPRGFAFPDRETVALLPYRIGPDPEFGTFGLQGLARLAPEADLSRAREEVAALQAEIPDFFDALTPAFLEQARWEATVETLRDRTVGDVAAALWVVLGTVGLVLVIACANVANLILVRAETRAREVAIRAAVGAGRTRLALGYLSESLLLAVAAGALALVLAFVGVELLVAAGPAELPRLHEVEVGWRTGAFTLLVSLATGVLLGLLPAIRHLGRSFGSTLRRSGRAHTEDRESNRIRNGLVVAQLALAVVLLVGSGLMLRSFQQLRSVDPGIVTDGVAVVGLSAGEHRDRAEAAAFYQGLIEEARSLPGVVEVGAANSVPMLAAGLNGGSFAIESRPRAEDQLPPVAMNVVVAGELFEALGIEVLRGRGVERRDHEGGPPVAWVSRSFVRSFLPDADPLTERIAFNDSGPFMEIAGVVEDTRHFGLDEEIQPLIYVPMTGPGRSRGSLGGMLLVLETRLDDPLSLVPEIRRRAAGLDATIPVTRARTMDRIVAESTSDTSFTMTLLLVAATIALLLGAVGIYGVIAYVVGRRTREIGVRMAMGADGGAVRRMVVRQGMAVATVGIVLGLLGALGLTRLLASLLFEVSPTDPATFAAVTAVLVLVAAFASYLPARRASRVDPARALTAE